MSFRITLIHIWNKIRLYLSFLLFVFYLIIGILFLLTDTWIDFLPQGRGIIGSVLITYGVFRLYLAYRRYKNKHKHIEILSSKKKKLSKEEPENVETEAK
jgi:amino acid permease